MDRGVQSRAIRVARRPPLLGIALHPLFLLRRLLIRPRFSVQAGRARKISYNEATRAHQPDRAPECRSLPADWRSVFEAVPSYCAARATVGGCSPLVRPLSLSFGGEPSASTRVPYMVAPPRAVHLPQMYDLYQECINAMELVPIRLRGEGADWGERLPPSGVL